MIRFAGVLLIVTAAAWFPSLGGGFVYDSVVQIESDDFIHTRSNFWSVVSFRVLQQDVLDFNRPIMLLSLMFDSVVWGRNPFGYRLTNLLLHLLNCFFLWMLIRRMLQAGHPGLRGETRYHTTAARGAVFGALLFALHPLCAEVVCEPSNREDLLASIFVLVALFLGDVGSRLSGFGRKLLCGSFCVVSAFMSVSSKETGFATPFLLAGFWLFVRGGRQPHWWIAVSGASLVVMAGFLSMRFAFAPTESQIFSAPPSRIGETTWEIASGCARIFALYLRNIFWPVLLLADYSPGSIAGIGSGTAIALLGVVGIGAIIWSVADRRAVFLFIGILFALAPVSNVVPIYRPAADRYLYLPLIFIGALVAIALQALTVRGVPRTAWIVATGLCFTLALLSIRQQSFWDNRLALWSRERLLNAGSFTAHTALASALADVAGKPREALDQLQQMEQRFDVSKMPGFWVLKARLLEKLGRRVEADMAAQNALAIDSRYLNAAWMIRALRQTKKAAFEFEFIAKRAMAKSRNE